MSEAKNPDVLDAGLIGCAQAVEHYEMARYGTLKAWAEQLEMEDAAELLEETLEEEKAADEKLTELALSGLNQESEGDGDEDDEKEDEDEEKRRQPPHQFHVGPERGPAESPAFGDRTRRRPDKSER